MFWVMLLLIHLTIMHGSNNGFLGIKHAQTHLSLFAYKCMTLLAIQHKNSSIMGLLGLAQPSYSND